MAEEENQLVVLLENMLLTPSSDFYISKILHNPDGSSADPFTAKSVDLGTLTPAGAGLSIGVVLTDLLVKGLSNIQVIINDDGPEITVDGNTVTFNTKVPNTQDGYTRPADVPSQIEMTGGLNVSIEGTAMPPGTISITVHSVARATGIFIATEEVAGKLSTANIQVTKLELAPGTQSGNIVFDVKLDTKFSKTISDLLNQSDLQDSIVSQVNTLLKGEKVLEKLSDVATDKARAALSQS